MRQNLFALLSGLALSGAFFVAGLAQADPIKEPWQSQRERAIAIGNKACAGDRLAVGEVRRALAKGDPVFMNNIGSLQLKCDVCDTISESTMIDFQRRAAEAGYPIALFNCGQRLINGWGVPVDTARGVQLMEQAIEAGYGRAAALLAQEYASGLNLARDLTKSRAYVQIAEREGVAPDVIGAAREEIAKAGGAATGETPRQTADTTKQAGDTTTPAQYAALAVSTRDGGFGFAHDDSDEKSAAARVRGMQVAQRAGLRREVAGARQGLHGVSLGGRVGHRLWLGHGA